MLFCCHNENLGQRLVQLNCNCNWGTCNVPPTRRPRAHHRVNSYPGAQTIKNQNVWQLSECPNVIASECFFCL